MTFPRPRSRPSRGPRWLCALLAVAGIVPAAAATPADPLLPVEPRGIFLEPQITEVQGGAPVIRLVPGAILHWEMATVPPSRLRVDAAIPLPAGLGPPIPAGTVFMDEMGPGGRSACHYAPYVDGTTAVPLFCLADADGDGLSDHVDLGGRSASIAPIRLRPIPHEPPPGAPTIIDRRLLVRSVDQSAATISAECTVSPGSGMQHFNVFSVTEEQPVQWPRILLLPLRPGAHAAGWGLAFDVVRGAQGALWVRVTGHAAPWLKLRPPGTAVDFICGSLEATR